jgi:hypothetical protein
MMGHILHIYIPRTYIRLPHLAHIEQQQQQQHARCMYGGCSPGYLSQWYMHPSRGRTGRRFWHITTRMQTRYDMSREMPRLADASSPSVASLRSTCELRLVLSAGQGSVWPPECRPIARPNGLLLPFSPGLRTDFGIRSFVLPPQFPLQFPFPAHISVVMPKI